MRRIAAVTVLIAACAGLAGPAAAPAAKPGTFAGTLGVAVPKGGEAEVRAVSRADGRIAAARQLPRSGAFSLRLPAGSYLVLGTVQPAPGRGKATQVRTAVSLKAGQQRKRINIKRTKKRKRRATRSSARAAFVQELGQVTPDNVAIGLPNFTASGPLSPDAKAVVGGLNDLMITDMLDRGRSECDLTIVEVEHRADILKELEFQQSPYVDPSSRVTRNFIQQDISVEGTLKAAGPGRLTAEVKLRDARTGKEVGSLSRTFAENDLFDAMEQLAHAAADESCKFHQAYDVTLTVKGDGIFATHTGSGTIDTKLQAARGAAKGAAWHGSGPLQWGALTFASKTPHCSLIDPVAPQTTWSVTMLDSGGGTLQVTWGVGGSDAPTASIDCEPTSKDDPDPPPIPGMPGPSLLNIAPTTFDIPYAGGKQAVGGGINQGGDGFFNNGTITVTPNGVARSTP